MHPRQALPLSAISIDGAIENIYTVESLDLSAAATQKVVEALLECGEAPSNTGIMTDALQRRTLTKPLTEVLALRPEKATLFFFGRLGKERSVSIFRAVTVITRVPLHATRWESYELEMRMMRRWST